MASHGSHDRAGSITQMQGRRANGFLNHYGPGQSSQSRTSAGQATESSGRGACTSGRSGCGSRCHSLRSHG